MKSLFLLLFAAITSSCFSQDYNVTSIVPLDGEVFETSGLIWLDGRLITHNDSGSDHFLYEIDTVDGEVTRRVVVANATNVDWEDICFDEEYIYIGDFGNNYGNRTDLRIYKISISDYLTTENDTVYCDTIFFNYTDQESFEPALYTTNYDAEAIIAKGDSLYIFTKNWGDIKTNIYAISKTPDTYSISIVDSLDPEGLITGACYDEEKNELLLTGYSFTTPFLMFVSSFTDTDFSEGNIVKWLPTFEGSFQIEGVTALGEHSFFVSSEKNGEALSYLHRINVFDFLNVGVKSTNKISIYPTMVNKDVLYVNNTNLYGIFIYDLNGRIVKSGFGNEIELSSLKNSCYIVLLKDAKGNIVLRERIVKI